MKTIADSIMQKCGVHFLDSKLRFENASYNRYLVSGDRMSIAINNIREEQQEINVLYWFNDFWVYIEIRFEEAEQKKRGEKVFPLAFLTLSIFQGEASDDKKIQLFRAEWDNFNNPSEEHPQPHWHIYPHKYTSKTHDDFEAIAEILKEEESFENQIKNIKSGKITNIKSFHFAMEARWSLSEGYIHRITNETMIVDWFFGLLKSIREQLTYISRLP